MTMIRVEAQLTSDELVKAVEQLDAPELEHFVARIIALQARRKAPSLSQTEAELLQGINQGLPADLQRRYGELIARRQAGQLEPDEHRELLRLTEQVEGIEARRADQLAALARQRGISLSHLVSELGIAPIARHD